MRSKTLNILYKRSNLQVSYFLRPGREKALVYLHGGACSKEDFAKSLELKKLNKHTIFSFDFPGCGNSFYPPDICLNMEDLSKITNLILKKLHIKNPILIAHSMGKIVAMLFIEKHKQIRGLISIEGNLAPENCVYSRKLAYKDSFENFKNQEIKNLLIKLQNSRNPGLIKWSEHFKKCNLKAFYDYIPSIVHCSDKKQLLKKYIRLKIPTLYVYGDKNKNKLKSLIKTLKNNHCQTIEIPHSNHFPFYDNPKIFYNHLTKFINSI